ncbi:MAG: oxidoreductase [Rhodobacterales bacterium RIFCSPHIGHO2_02_FULL_62_130]|nr:MAG: oxidoreductase [Rhodobacterales bacterium RIFCSPHIGHO2_02_FULL_62_130]OHC60194.1 MAG: oxidoreductase [Rhodobacterales bacterium RIFCSPHIGHO2_12_FULL_62_75]HCY98903.1 oxidoreductase [Rhodobacter sp.]
MKMKPVGKTGLEISEIGFGTAPLGEMPDTYGYSVDEATARAALHAIFDGPVNLMDTSRNYGLGRSEQRIGDAIRERGGLPAGFVLSTKLDRDMQTGRFDGARARRSFEESLGALGLDHVQMLHLHDPEHALDLTEITRKGGALDMLFQLKAEGLATSVGLAMGRLDIMLPLVKAWPFDVVLSHNRYSLLNRSADALFDYARSKDMTVINAAPYAGGVLAKGSAQVSKITYQDVDAAKLEPVRRIEQICAAHGIAPGAPALQFSLHDPRIASTVVGVSRAERVAQTLRWADQAISAETWAELRALAYETTDPEAERVYRPG